MDQSEPVSLVFALVVAGVGLVLFVVLFVRLFLELRRKRRLRDRRPELDVDDDLRRYVDRVFLLIEAWRPRLDDERLRRVEDLWQEVLDEVEVLQAARNEGDDAPEHVANLIELEETLDRTISP